MSDGSANNTRMPRIESVPTDPSPYHSNNKFANPRTNFSEKYDLIAKKGRFNSINYPESQKNVELTSINSYASPSKKSLDLSAAREKNKISYNNLFH